MIILDPNLIASSITISSYRMSKVATVSCGGLSVPVVYQTCLLLYLALLFHPKTKLFLRLYDLSKAHESIKISICFVHYKIIPWRMKKDNLSWVNLTRLGNKEALNKLWMFLLIYRFWKIIFCFALKILVSHLFTRNEVFP